MPKATSKKKTATKVGGGGVGTRVSKFNLKLVIPIVLVVAALGGFYIFRKSSAGAGESFSIPAASSSVSGGQVVEKNGAPQYRLLSASNSSGMGFFQANVSSKQSAASSQLCLQYLGSEGDFTVVINFVGGGAKQKTFTPKKHGGEACVDILNEKRQGKVARLISAWPDLSPSKPSNQMTLARFFGKL